MIPAIVLFDVVLADGTTIKAEGSIMLDEDPVDGMLVRLESIDGVHAPRKVEATTVIPGPNGRYGYHIYLEPLQFPSKYVNDTDDVRQILARSGIKFRDA